MLLYAPRRCSPRRSRHLFPARTLRGAWPVMLLVAGGCDVPTSLPKWDTQWLVPVENTSFPVTQLLPASVTMTADRSAFVVPVAPLTLTRPLAVLCGACGALSGQRVAKPAFTATLTDTLRLPSDVPAATLAGGAVVIAITNGFAFDPIRPGGLARGTVTVTLTSGGSALGTVALDGTVDALPPGGTVTRSVPLSAAPVAGRIVLTLTVISPAGEVVRIDPTERFALTATPQGLRMSDVTVSVTQKPVTIQAAQLNVSDIDASLVERVKAGALVLDITNPFGVTGPLTLRITGPGVNLTRSVQLGSGQTTQTVPFTQEEIQSILGRSGVTFSATGAVGATQAVKLAPSQVVQLNAQLELTLGPKEG